VKRIVVAYDGSSAARRALEHASDLALPDDEVTVVNVMPEPAVGSQIAEPPEARAQHDLLKEALRLMSIRGVEPAVLARTGSPAPEILAAADEVDADVIVVGRDGGRPRVLGSISGRIVRRAACDVLVVHARSAETNDP
jgi:nucleotide-binding universal stress UspA family protein